MDNILKVAIELATKEGQSFESLPEVMKNAFLHNADCAITDRAGKVLSKTGEVMEVYTCSVCKDEGWIDEKPCYECNPVGLKTEESYPAPLEGEELTGVDVSGTVTKEIQEVEREITVSPGAYRELKPTEYYCTKCNSIHRETSKIGKRHLEHKAE